MNATTDRYADFLTLDYLIFSSHKTGTMTCLSSLQKSGFKVRHTHYLETLKAAGIEDFPSFLQDYQRQHGRKLQLLSFYRSPYPRLISSLFQQFHSDEIRVKGAAETETTVMRSSTAELIALFTNEVEHRTLHGYRESLMVLSQLLNFELAELKRSNSRPIRLETESAVLIVSYFDKLIQDPAATLGSMIEYDRLSVDVRNVTANKTIAAKYRQFQDEFHYPEALRRQILMDNQEVLVTLEPTMQARQTDS